jgi:hypothetical protein
MPATPNAERQTTAVQCACPNAKAVDAALALAIERHMLWRRDDGPPGAAGREVFGSSRDRLILRPA